MGIIVCGFPGVGKTEAAARSKWIEDCESSGFRLLENGRDWVRSYVDYVNNASKEYSSMYFLLSCHAEVRNELQSQGIPFVVVVPKKEIKDEYLARYLKRGSPVEFIEKINNNWDDYLTQIDNSIAPVIHLYSGQYIADILPVYGKE